MKYGNTPILVTRHKLAYCFEDKLQNILFNMLLVYGTCLSQEDCLIHQNVPIVIFKLISDQTLYMNLI